MSLNSPTLASETCFPAEIKERIGQRRLFRARLRICLRLQRCRSSADQAQASLDERSGQADEPHIKDATKRRFYEAHNELRVHLLDFVDAWAARRTYQRRRPAARKR
jgi:hypothetical protein